jgi:hypothetical protein
VPNELPEPAPIRASLDRLNEQLAVIPPGKRAVVVMTGHIENGMPTGKIGLAWRMNGVLSVGADWEAKLRAKPQTNVYVGFAF